MSVRSRRSSVLAGALYFLVIALAWAGQTYSDFLHDLARRESGLNSHVVNQFGFAGLFQMGGAALKDAGYYVGDTRGNTWNGRFTGKNGVTSLSSFLNNPDAQVKAIVDYEIAQAQVIHSLGLDQYLGQVMNGVVITQSGLLAGAHLVGYQGLSDYLRSNGKIVRADGNDTHINEYIQKFGGYAVGGPAPTAASVLSAEGGKGIAVGSGPKPSPIPNPLPGANPTFPSPPSSTGLSPEQAFFQSTGYQYNDVGNLTKMLVAALLFAWLAWSVAQAWHGFHIGRTQLTHLKSDMFRGLIVMTIGILLLL